ncbi:MBL fold metallo-hydrolase [Salinimicrobium sp. CDJ15-91]|nr:MBL fold metallo-hydrolase [Salinimicrobium oceani]
MKRFGRDPKGQRLQRIKNSPNYKDGSFQNLEQTSVNPGGVSMFRILKKMIFRPSSVRPALEIPNAKVDLKKLDKDRPQLVWFGHSSYLLQINGYKVLVDPVFSGNASPFRFFGKAFPGADHYKAQDMPEIDLLVITHDHYDHLDYPSIKKLAPRVKRIITSLGVGAHLETWGVKNDKINELDWWETFKVDDEINLTATPSRHFSGRSLKRNQTLWSSFVLDIFGYRIFIGGDSGYDGTFRKVGEKFGPFDLALLECGQFGKYWPQIHMFPEQTVQAALDLKAKKTVPVHWGKFVLSYHPWNEPIQQFTRAAQQANLSYLTPKIGAPIDFSVEHQQQPWWLFENKEKNYERESAILG